MKMDNDNFVFQDQEEEEAISLSDFPLTPDENNHHHTATTDSSPFQDLRSPSSEQSDLFEFLSNHNSNMSHAEDIIYCGKLIPFKDQDDQSPSYIYETQNPATPNNHKLHNFQRRRSDSLSELKTCRSNSSSSSSKTRMRNSRSLDYQKLSRNSSMSSDSPDIHRNPRSSSRLDGTIKIPKPRWYIIMFGSVKFPPEMDLRDIKNRQVHRTVSPPLFPSLEVVKKVPVNRKSSWEVLKVLSCRDDASVHVTTSLACMPRV